MSEWISVKDRLPENEKTVLACAEMRINGTKHSHVIVRAFHTDGKTPVCDSSYSWEYLECEEWSEEHDDFVVCEGWWESVRYGDEFSAVSDFVTHWMPLPEPPGVTDINDGCKVVIAENATASKEDA